MMRTLLGISILVMSLSGCGKTPVVEPTNVITASEAGNNKPPFPAGSPGDKNKAGSSGAPSGPPGGGGSAPGGGGSAPNGPPGGGQPRK